MTSATSTRCRSRLEVHDDGRGFDVAGGRARAGADGGVSPMRERVALVDGRSTIEHGADKRHDRHRDDSAVPHRASETLIGGEQ